MPELPEVTALAADLDSRLSGRVIDRLSVVAFAALKTFEPPVSALSGETISGVTRHGKFLDIEAGELHVLIHLARAGWIRWRDGPPPPPTGRPGRGPLAARLVLDDGSGLDITEAGTKKSLSISVVHDASEVPGVARLGPDPLDESFTVEVFAGILRDAGRAQIKGVLRNQSVIASRNIGPTPFVRAAIAASTLWVSPSKITMVSASGARKTPAPLSTPRVNCPTAPPSMAPPP